MDFIIVMPPSEGFTTIWMIVDRFSKMAHFVPPGRLPSVSELAQLFIKEVFRLPGCQEEILSLRGVQFVAKFWRPLCKSLQISLSFSSAYHPQTNGYTERVKQVPETYLCLYISSSQDDWASLLPWAEITHNNNFHKSSSRTLFFTVYGLNPLVPKFSLLPASPLAVVTEALGNILKFGIKLEKHFSKPPFDIRRKRIPKAGRLHVSNLVTRYGFQ